MSCSSSVRFSLGFLLLSGGVLGSAGCGGARGADRCSSDQQCENGYACVEGLCQAGARRAGENACTGNNDCQSGEYCNGGFCSTLEPGMTACTRDSECTAQQYCNAGVCAARSNTTEAQCQNGSDCVAPQRCNVISHRCVQCLNDDHCPANTTCQSNGTCGTAGSSGCTTNQECNGLVCNQTTHRCVQCLTSANCPSGQTCRENSCFVSDGGAPLCTSQAQCDSYGMICNTSQGRCASCSNTAQCGAGRTCNSGRCQAQPTGGGGGDGSCQSRTDCGGDACFLNICMPCLDDFMCFDLSDLLTGGGMVCNPNTGKCTAPECATANDCPAGEGCYGGGHCGPCLEDAECRTGQVCNANTGVCGAAPTSTPPPTTTPGTKILGQSCNANSDCVSGLSCVGDPNKVCTRPCTGSGKGGNADCPSGYACQNYDSGALDGVQLCTAAASLPANFPGQPFTQMAGTSCASGNACETSICFSDTKQCARACLANRDCAPNEVCYALDDGTSLTGYHICFTSDTVAYKPAGGTCSSSAQCDSGLCMGECNDGSPCNSAADCFSGSCSGTCQNHCRNNADCSATQACAPWPVHVDSQYSGWVPMCMPKYYSGTQANGTTCTDDAQCSSDWCAGGICTTPCGLSEDCTGALASKTCRPVSFTDDYGDPLFSMSFCL